MRYWTLPAKMYNSISSLRHFFLVPGLKIRVSVVRFRPGHQIFPSGESLERGSTQSPEGAFQR
jgi:hypothetical protein